MMNMTTPNRLSHRGRRIAGATAILAPLGLLAGFGTASAAGATTPPVPAGYTSLTDRTGLLTINVPAEWTATDLNPIDGEPSIWATTDMEQYEEGVGVPGVSFDVAVHQEADTEARLTAFMSTYGIDEGDCDAGEPRPVTTFAGTGHGALEGTANFYECGGSRVMGFVGIAADGSGIEVFLQLPEGEDLAIADQIMTTFAYGDLSTLGSGTVPGGSGVPDPVAPTPAPVPAPVSTIPAIPVPTVAPVPVPGSTAPAPAPGIVPATTVAGGSVAPGSLIGQVPVTDDTGRLTIQVPAEWTDTNTAESLGNPSVWASTDLDAFDATVATSGVQFDVSDLVLDPTGSLYAVSQIESNGVDLTQCTEVAPVAPWTSPQTSAGVYTGAIVTYDCGGTLITSAVGVSADGATELDILIKLAPGDDPAIADNILATFTLA